MMRLKGLAKLAEECGELIQIAAKKMAYFDVDIHPDGEGSMKERLENELADVMASSIFVVQQFELDSRRIHERAAIKLARFHEWNGTTLEQPTMRVADEEKHGETIP